MRYVLLIAGREDDREATATEERDAVYRKIGEWFAEHGAAGRIVGGEELQPVGTATTVRLHDGDALVTDGPFIESKEVLGGFALVEAEDLDEAIALAKSWPSPRATLEIRPVVPHEG